MTKKPFWPANIGVSVLAVAAIVLILSAVLFPVFVGRKHDGANLCLSNIKMADMAVQVYATDNDNRLPPATTWMDAAEKYAHTPAVLASPDVRDHDPSGYGYAMNVAMSCKPTAQVHDPGGTALIFDSVLLARNACSGFYGFPDPPRPHSNFVGFVDGHARSMRPEELARYGPDWNPDPVQNTVGLAPLRSIIAFGRNRDDATPPGNL